MSVPPPEFSRRVPIDRIGDRAGDHVIEADANERARLAERFGLIAIDRLVAQFGLRRTGDLVHAEGRVEADAVQSCIATGEPVPARIDEAVTLRFAPTREDATLDEIELGDADLDTVDYDGGAVDLGEAAAESLALALDPFPRSPEADATLRAAGVRSEEEARAATNPFSALLGKSSD